MHRPVSRIPYRYSDKEPSTASGDTRSLRVSGLTFSESDMDQLDHISSQIEKMLETQSEMLQQQASMEAEMRLNAKMVLERDTAFAQSLDKSNHGQEEQGKRIGALEAWRGIMEDRDARSRVLRAAVTTIITGLATTALLKAFGLV